MNNNRIREIREFRCFTLEVLSSKIGISKSGLNSLETGRVKLSRKWLLKLSEVLECTIEQLQGTEPFEGIKVINDPKEDELPLKDDYVNYTLDLLEQIKLNHSLLSSIERKRIFNMVYKLVFSFFEKNENKENLKRKIKLEEEVLELNKTFLTYLEEKLKK